MSPVNRGRGGKRRSKKARGQGERVLFAVPDDGDSECGCPACTGEEVDLHALVEQLTTGIAELSDQEDPLVAELAGASFLGLAASYGLDDALVSEFVPAAEAQATPGALAMLLALAAVNPAQTAGIAEAAAKRLAAAGIARPRWADELAERPTVGHCHRIADPAGTGSVLVCSFARAGREHALVVFVDHTDCGAAERIELVDTEGLADVLAAIRAQADLAEIETVKPAELRWYVEQALDARAKHDEGDDAEPDIGDEDGPGYTLLATLARARMVVLPNPRRPANAPEFGHQAEAPQLRR